MLELASKRMKLLVTCRLCAQLRNSAVVLFPRVVVFFLFLHVGIFSGRSENIITSSGILNETTFRGNQPIPQQSSSNEFRATVSTDGKWTLEVSPIHKKDDVLYGKKDITYMTFDGSDTYFCQYTEAVEGITNGRPGITGTRPITAQPQLAYISAGGYPFSPFDNDKKVQVLWLVYGAGQYIHDSQADTMPLPWRPARWSLRSYGFRLKYELSPQSPYIPISLQFIRDSKLDLQSEDAEYNRPGLNQPVDKGMLTFYHEDLIARKAQWHDGDVAGTLTTGTFTNVAGVSLPLSFEVKVYLTPGNLFRLYDGTIITNVAAGNNSGGSVQETFRPSILTKLIVTDARFRFRDAMREVDNIQYNLANGEQWLPTNSDVLQKEFKYYLDTPTFSARHRFSILSESLKRTIIIVFLSVSTILLLMLIFKIFRNSHQNKE